MVGFLHRKFYAYQSSMRLRGQSNKRGYPGMG